VVDEHGNEQRPSFRKVVESYGIDWTLKFIASVAGVYFIYATYVSDSRDAAEFAANKAKREGVEAEQQSDTNEWAEHAYKGFNCWSRESKLYSEDTKRCTEDALLKTDVEQNAQIAANASVSGANAQTIRVFCEILLSEGKIDTCAHLP
jgi:hypothetical protein